MSKTLFPEDTGIDSWDWREITERSDRYRQWPSGELTTEWHADDIAEVVHAIGGCSCQLGSHCGSYCDSRFYGVVRLKDGRFASFEAWNDTSGWGCQDGIEWGVADDYKTIVALGLSDEGRRALGLVLS